METKPSLFTKIYKFFAPISTPWWCFWSNIRFRNTIRKDTTLLREEDRVSTIKEIRALASRVYKKFTWTADGADQLWDAITPPSQNYSNYINTPEVRDDCDGFHSIMYYCLSLSGIECYLLSVIARGGSHCVLLFKYKNKWYVNDYSSVHGPYGSAEEAIKNYNKIFEILYKPLTSVLYNGLIKYDYETGKLTPYRGIKINLNEPQQTTPVEEKKKEEDTTNG